MANVADLGTSPASSTSGLDVTRLAQDLDAIHDLAVLRQLVLDKERDLHVAAQLGLAVARKNQDIEQRLQRLTHTVERQALSRGVRLFLFKHVY